MFTRWQRLRQKLRCLGHIVASQLEGSTIQTGLDSEMRDSTYTTVQWQLKITKGGVPANLDTFSPKKVKEYLHRHGVRPEPPVPQTVMLSLAQSLVKYQMKGSSIFGTFFFFPLL